MPETLLLHVRDALVTFGKKPLFEDMEFSILEGDKIALVGKNGAGKTTLMNLITGARQLDDGTRWQLEGTTIGYLQQEIAVKRGQTIRGFVKEHVKANEETEAVDYRIDAVLHPLDLDPDATMDTLSGGQLRRAALGRALVENPDILLLDEPTNHLDLDIIEWLENYLRGFKGAVVCVSHDRAFLSAMSDKVFWLDRGRMRVCPKGFKDFEDWQTMMIEQEGREIKNRQKWLEMEVEWASRGVPARRKRNQKRLETCGRSGRASKPMFPPINGCWRKSKCHRPSLRQVPKSSPSLRGYIRRLGIKKSLMGFLCVSCVGTALAFWAVMVPARPRF
jgi:ATP-binding cassette subfamily F protein uup